MTIYKLGAFLVVLSLVFTACESDDEGTITENGNVQVHAKLYYGDKPIVLEENMAVLKEHNVRLSKFSFFASDFSLTSNNGNVLTDLFEIEEFDFSTKNLTQAGADEGIDVGTFSAPVGDYTGLSFHLGVNKELNAQKPNDFAANHPLGNQDMYWVAWESYIFSITEGRYDSLGNENFSNTFAWHTGGDDSYQSVQRAKNLTISTDDVATINIKIDLKKAMEDSTAPDMTTDKQLHTEASKDIMLSHAKLLAESISVE